VARIVCAGRPPQPVVELSVVGPGSPASPQDVLAGLASDVSCPVVLFRKR